jgi:hypothetical protein
MSQAYAEAVMDVLPWPDGHGFTGSGTWWEYVLSQDEQQRLNNLMGLALLDTSICDKLLHMHDDSLLNAFDLSAETKAWLHSIKATNLAELAEAIVSRVKTSSGLVAAT